MEWLIRNGGNAEKVPKYDCGTSDRSAGAKDSVIGTAFIAYGVVAEQKRVYFQLIYILDLMVMTKKQHRKLSCYKIMIALGIYDMAAIAINSLLTGYFWLKGSNYCTNPTFMFFVGAIGLGLWCGACMNCFVLVINRLLDIWNKNILEMLFDGGRTWMVLLIPFIYSLYFCFFTTPLLFNSNHTAWFFSTFAPGHNNEDFFIQCASICMANLIAALIYVYMQFFTTPSYFVLIGHICWQLGHGFPAIVYLLLNRTIQREVLEMLRISKPTKTSPLGQSHMRVHGVTDSYHP
ncbi:hypothetical protein NECAME_12203 [Necator americanus]|uniref:7TM GPCR serpentine receptor class x (Srx) domain-containing protein n=1 Tax=Necator americanus TaxID=51031 RepID=W2T3X8_NECAM|nr:hypothetical protein NECAME_12203 [Necator americanus]ETN75677.1 hypothetical protein NECAME_12203 [Necator americanus]